MEFVGQDLPLSRGNSCIHSANNLYGTFFFFLVPVLVSVLVVMKQRNLIRTFIDPSF